MRQLLFHITIFIFILGIFQVIDAIKKCNVLWFASCCSLFTFHSTDDAQGPLAIRARRAVYGSARQEENLHLTGSMKGSAT